jgi:hypothetical protein
MQESAELIKSEANWMRDAKSRERERSGQIIRGPDNLKRRVKSQHGLYLLEYSLVFFGVAVFLVGVSDISRIFHARGAVRAGVTEGLRCLYTSDAKCGGQSAGSGWAPGARFNARIAGGGLNGYYELPRVSYQLTSSWFNESIYQAEFATKRLTQVTLTQPQDPYRRYQVMFPGVAHAAYILKTRELPIVTTGSGSTSAERVLNPRFIDPDTGAARSENRLVAAPTLTIKSKSVSPGVVGRTMDSSFTIGISDLFSGSNDWSNLKSLETSYNFRAPCYQGAKTTLPDGGSGISWPGSGAPASCSYRSSSEALYNGASMKVPVMIHVAGDGYISSSKSWPEWRGVLGQVELELWQSDKLIASLGGREFQRTSSSSNSAFNKQWGNFVTRGAGFNSTGAYDVTQSYVDACKAAGYDGGECKNYITLPLVEVGSPVTLKFKLKWRSDGATTKPDVNITWAGGDVRIFYPSFRAVHESRACGYSAAPNTCSASVAPMRTSFNTTDLGSSLSYSEGAETSCGRDAPTGFLGLIPDALENLRSDFQSGQRQLEPVSFWSHGNSSDKCADKISDVSCEEEPREYIKGCEPNYFLPGDALSKCALDDYQPARDTVAAPRFSYGSSDRSELRGACSGEQFPECAKESLVYKGTTIFGAESKGCRAALPINLPLMETRPLFKDTCVDTLAEFVKRYRERHGVPEGIDVISKSQDEEPVITSERPTNSCWESREIKGDEKKSWLCAEGTSRAVANRCCERYGQERCSLEQLNTGSGGSSGDGNEQIASGAIERVYSTVHAAYPPARMDSGCGSQEQASSESRQANCLAVQAAPAGDGTQATIQASMRVPLALFGWLGLRDSAVVSHQETRVLESSLVGG